jgi:hypothetical protein
MAPPAALSTARNLADFSISLNRTDVLNAEYHEKVRKIVVRSSAHPQDPQIDIPQAAD